MLKSLQLTTRQIPMLLVWTAIVGLLLAALSMFPDSFRPLLQGFTLTLADGIGIVAFFAIFFLLNRLMGVGLFIPYITLLEAREAATTGGVVEAAETAKRAENLRLAFEDKVTETRVAANKEKIAALNEAKDKAREVVLSAEEEAKQLLQKARESTAADMAKVKEALVGEVSAMSDSLVKKILDPEKGKEHVLSRV